MKKASEKTKILSLLYDCSSEGLGAPLFRERGRKEGRRDDKPKSVLGTAADKANCGESGSSVLHSTELRNKLKPQGRLRGIPGPEWADRKE